MKKSQLLHAPIFRLAHMTAKGDGSAITLQFFPPSKDYGDGHVTITLANQLQISPESYNWADAESFDLDFIELSLMLQVLRGETEENRIRRNGQDGAFQVLNFRHEIYNAGRYSLLLTNHGGNLRHFALNNAEALGVSVALEAALARCVFPNL